MHYKPAIWGIPIWKTLFLSIFPIASAWSLSWGHHGSAAPSLAAPCRCSRLRLVHVSPPDSHLASSMFSHYTSMGIIGIWATKQHPHDMFLDIFLMVSFLTQKGSTSCGCAQHNWINTFQQANAFLRTRIRQADDPRGTFVHSLCWQVRRQHVQCATSGSQCSCQLHALCASKILEKVSTGVISHLFLMPLETGRNYHLVI